MANSNHLKDRVYVYAILWVVSYSASLGALKTLTLSTVVGIILVIIPILTFLLFVYKYYRSFQLMDEVEIKIQMEAVVIAFALGFVTLMKLGLLDLITILDKENWGYRHLLPIFAVYYFIGLFIAKRKYNFDYEKHD